MEYNVKKPFTSEEENEQYRKFYEKDVMKNLDRMILSLDKDMMEYLEMFITGLALEINKKFPEPNYSSYIICRIKSAKSDIDKLEDYIKRMKKENGEISLKEITDLIGIRIIVEKIPHNISISKKNQNYKELKELQKIRKKNTLYSEECHDFETSILDGECTIYEYYKKSKELLEHIYDMLNEGEESEKYACKLKETYQELIKDCERNMKFIEVIGNGEDIVRKDRKTNSFYVGNKSLSDKIDYTMILKDFDSRIDSKLALNLYSSSLPNMIKNSEILNGLGGSVNMDPSRTKKKREESGYVADFFGIDFKGIPINCECQIMSIDEYLASTLGYAAHSNMPGKNHIPFKIPPAYVKKYMKLLEDFNDVKVIDSDNLRLLRNIMKVKDLSEDELTTIDNIITRKKGNDSIEVSKKENIVLKNIVQLTDEQKEKLEKELYKEGITNFKLWAENISALHATARLDKDSSVKDRVKIYYDSPYECLAHVLRQQVEGYNLDSVESNFIESYLEKIYAKQEEWLAREKIKDHSIIEFELLQYIKDELPVLRKKLKNFDSTTVNFEEEETEK